MSDAIAPESMGETNFLTRLFGDESGARQAQGLGVWFGAWRAGRLGRIGYLLATLVLYGLLGLVQWFLLGLMEPSPLQLTPQHEPVSEAVQSAARAASLAISLLTLVVILNVTAKRLRAIGAPGWGGAAVLALLNGVAIFAFPGVADPWATIAIMALLIVIPNGMLGGRRGR